MCRVSKRLHTVIHRGRVRTKQDLTQHSHMKGSKKPKRRQQNVLLLGDIEARSTQWIFRGEAMVVTTWSFSILSRSLNVLKRTGLTREHKWKKFTAFIHHLFLITRILNKPSTHLDFGSSFSKKTCFQKLIQRWTHQRLRRKIKRPNWSWKKRPKMTQ